MVCTSAGKLIIQVLENHGKVILEVSFCFPQWKRNSGRGEPISSCWDFSLLCGFLACHTLSPILCSRDQWITHPAPAKFLLCLLYHYHPSKPSIIIKKKKIVEFVAQHLGAAPSTIQMANYQLQVRYAFVSLTISLSGLPFYRRRRRARDTTNHSSISWTEQEQTCTWGYKEGGDQRKGEVAVLSHLCSHDIFSPHKFLAWPLIHIMLQLLLQT